MGTGIEGNITWEQSCGNSGIEGNITWEQIGGSWDRRECNMETKWWELESKGT